MPDNNPSQSQTMSKFWDTIWPKIVGGGLWTFSGRLSVVISGLVVNSLLTRMMTPEEIGSYFLAMSIITLLSIILPFGLDQYIVKIISEASAKRHGIQILNGLRYTFIIISTFSLIMFCLYFLGFFHWIFRIVFDNVYLQSITIIILLASIALSTNNISAQALRGFQQFKMAVILQNIFPSLALLGIIFACFLQKIQISVYVILIILMCVNAISFVFFLIKIKPLSIKLNQDGSLLLSTLLKSSYPIWISSLLMFCVSQSDIWIVAAVLEEKDVAVYGSVLRVISIIPIPLLIANTVLPSIIADLYTRNELTNLEKSLRYTSAISAIPALFIVVIYIAVGDSILSTLFTDFYSEGYTALVILSIGLLGYVYFGLATTALLMTGHQLASLKITGITGLFTVLLSIFLVNTYGIIGAATATSIGLTTQGLLMMIYAKRKIGVWTHSDFSILKLTSKRGT